jgi:hypothetical protein
VEKENDAYDKLMEAGGRPPYPRHLLEQFARTPEKFLSDDRFRDIILFYRPHGYGPNLCSAHLSRWMFFRKLQQLIRTKSFKNEAALIHASGSSLTWDDFLNHPTSQGWSGSFSFDKYADNIRARLAKHAFIRPYCLKQDLEQQDRLTDWAEYLGFEYYFYDKAASYAERTQQKHDAAWQNLSNSNLLRPSETYEAICDVETAWQRHAEKEMAENELEAAASADVEPRTEACRRLAKAEEHLREIKARTDAIVTFHKRTYNHREAKDAAEEHASLLRWAVQQSPIIELEVKSHFKALNRAEDDLKSEPAVSPYGEDGASSEPPLRRSRTRKRGRCSSADDELPLKRAKIRAQDGEDMATIPAATRTANVRSTAQPSNIEAAPSEPPRLRGSARIAERVQRNATSAANAPSRATASSAMQPQASRAKKRKK